MAKKKRRKRLEIYGGPFDGEQLEPDEVVGKEDIFTYDPDTHWVHLYRLRKVQRTNGGRVRRLHGYFHYGVMNLDTMDREDADELRRKMSDGQ